MSEMFNTEPTISVGILLQTEIFFELKGDFKLENGAVATGIHQASAEKGKLVFEGKMMDSILFIPQNSKSTFILKSVSIGIGFHWEQQTDQEFEGALQLVIESGQVRAINIVPLESYLKSVISSEMSAMNDSTLLEVHAIVSRSWLLAQIESNKLRRDYSAKACNDDALTIGEIEITKWYDREDHDGFDVCADDHCQRYQGITRVVSENAEQAVKNSQGRVLMYQDRICDARFSKCCGGITENFENVWQPEHVPYLRSVSDGKNKIELTTDFYTISPDAFCNTKDKKVLEQIFVDFDQSTTDFFRWQVCYTCEELTALVKRKSGIDFGMITALFPVERGESGRIIKLKIIGEKQTVLVGKELEIRKWLSDSHLYSSAFEVEKTSEGFVLNGAGWGHGVGMCQIGAAVMSHKNYTVDEILEHYFQGAKLEKVY